MKVELTVKNTGRVMNPKANDVILYDGDIWYVTTKAELLKEVNDLLEQCRAELDALKAENASFKSLVAGQVLEMSELIKKLYSDKGE